MQANDKNCRSSLWRIRLWMFLQYSWTVSWDFHEYCSLNIHQIFMNSFMRISWILFLKCSSNTHEQFHENVMNIVHETSSIFMNSSLAYYESVIHKMFKNSYFHELCHLTFMRKFMNIFHESSWRIHEYFFMNDLWANIHSFLFMNYYFHELCHLTFMRKSWIFHEQYSLLFFKSAWIFVHEIFMNKNVHELFIHELLFWWTVPFNVHARAWTVHVLLMDVHEQFSWTFHE